MSEEATVGDSRDHGPGVCLRRRCTGITPTATQKPTVHISPSPVPTATSVPTVQVPGDYPTIPGAIDAAQGGDLIIVSPGTYTENIDFCGKSVTLCSIDPSDPDVVACTTLDGGGRGTVVTFRGGESARALLTGLTITNGSGTLYRLSTAEAAGQVRQYCGGGMFGTPVEKRYCGGGILIENASPTIEGNIIMGNKVKHGGGGIFFSSSSSPHIRGNTVAGNEALGGAGIFVIDHSSPEIEGTTITGNKALESGGRIHVGWGSSPRIVGNDLTSNEAFIGGIMVFNNSSPMIVGNAIVKNRAPGGGVEGGGGIFVGASSRVTIEGNTISGNRGGPVAASSWSSSRPFPLRATSLLTMSPRFPSGPST
jgi:parallel beta-helix repeat protein